MKKLSFLFTLLFISMNLNAAVYYASNGFDIDEHTSTNVSYSLTKDDSYASGTTIDCGIITLTFGEAGGADFRPAEENPIDDFFICYTPGNGVNGNKSGGTFYLFVPKKDGLLTVGVNQNRTKRLYVEEDGAILPDYDGITLNESQPSNYVFSFIVKAGSTYKLYCTGSKLGFYGFIFNSNIVRANNITMIYGSDVPELTYTCADGGLNGTPKLSTTATKTSPVGTYPIKVERGTLTDEGVICVDGTLTIAPAPLTVSVQDVTITRGEKMPSFTLKYEGLQNDETAEVAFTKKPTVKTSAQNVSPAGVYDIYPDGGEAPNYAITYSPGKLTIQPASGDKWRDLSFKREITHTQPMTGLVVGTKEDEYGQILQLGRKYFLPSEVVKGCKEDGTIIYDWSSFDDVLSNMARIGRQLIPRFRYVWPGTGPTAVPDYIKQLPDYHETYSDVDGPTYYPDWSNPELQRFTLQFYTDFFKRYAHDPRLAFLQVGFGHWAEYHIAPTPVEYGKNFPSLEFQKKFLQHISEVSDGMPWLISKNAGGNSPVAGDDELLALRFGLFEDSFMGEFFLNGGYKDDWNGLGGETRWQFGAVGGEIGPTAEESDAFLSPEGLFGHFFEDVASEYHVTFMGGNVELVNSYCTPERVKQASMATGYRFVLKKCATDGKSTLLLVSNEGIAPIYRDAYFAVGDVRSETSLKGLLPNDEMWIEIAASPRSDGNDIKIVSDYILPQQEIEFEVKSDPRMYTYTVNEVINGNIVRSTPGQGVPDSEVAIPYRRYHIQEGKLYLKNASGGLEGMEYNHYFTLTTNGQTENINYNQTDVADVLFLAEAEDIPGMTLCDNDNMRVRCSNCAAAYAADGAVAFVTLPAGSYQLTAFIHDSSKNPDSKWSFLAGDKEIANFPCTVADIQEFQSDVFTLSEETTLYIVQGGGASSGIDLIYITKKKQVTVIANDLSMVYGDNVPTLTYKTEGDELNGMPSLSTTATNTSPVGVYPITVSQGSVTNSNVTYVAGTLTISKAPLTVKVESVTREQYLENPEFVITYTGWKVGDNESVLTKKPTATTMATKDSPVGEYDIVVSGGEAQNYELSYQNGVLTIVESTAIREISVEHPADIYTLLGHKVRTKATTLEGLPKGVYIVNGKKVVVK